MISNRKLHGSVEQVKAGLQLVTGGLGGLGLVAAEELVSLGAPGVAGNRKRNVMLAFFANKPL